MNLPVLDLDAALKEKFFVTWPGLYVTNRDIARGYRYYKVTKATDKNVNITVLIHTNQIMKNLNVEL